MILNTAGIALVQKADRRRQAAGEVKLRAWRKRHWTQHFAALGTPEVLVEIEAIAHIGDK